MIDRRNMHSEYLSDQGKRTHLLDVLASMYEIICDLSGELLTLEHNRMTDDEMEARTYRACTLAMDLQADWAIVHPMLSDIYNDNIPIES